MWWHFRFLFGQTNFLAVRQFFLNCLTECQTSCLGFSICLCYSVYIGDSLGHMICLLIYFRFRSRDFSFNLFPVWQPYCWTFWSTLVSIHTSTINAPFGSVIIRNAQWHGFILISLLCLCLCCWWGRHGLDHIYIYNVYIYYVDLQLHMQSVPITTNVVSSNLTQAMCTRYNITW